MTDEVLKECGLFLPKKLHLAKINLVKCQECTQEMKKFMAFLRKKRLLLFFGLELEKTFICHDLNTCKLE